MKPPTLTQDNLFKLTDIKKNLPHYSGRLLFIFGIRLSSGGDGFKIRRVRFHPSASRPGLDRGGIGLCKIVVETLFLQQLIVLAAFDDLAAVKDQQLVSMPDRAQAVGYDEGSASFQQFFQRFLDQPFRAGIHAGGSLVQDQDPGVGQSRPRNGRSTGAGPAKARIRVRQGRFHIYSQAGQ